MTRVAGIDMETATIFVVGFVNHIPKGALLLVSDNPYDARGSARVVAKRQDRDRKARAGLYLEIRHQFVDRAAELGGIGQSICLIE